MVKLVPVDNDPFADEASPNLVPVEGDPFARSRIAEEKAYLGGMVNQATGPGIFDLIGAAGNIVGGSINDAAAEGIHYTGQQLPAGLRNAISYPFEVAGNAASKALGPVNNVIQADPQRGHFFSGLGNALTALPLAEGTAMTARALPGGASALGSNIRNSRIYKSQESGGAVPMVKSGQKLMSGTKLPDIEKLQKAVTERQGQVSNAYKKVDDYGTVIADNAAKELDSTVLTGLEDIPVNLQDEASTRTIGAIKALTERINQGKVNPVTGKFTQAPLKFTEIDDFRKLLSGDDSAIATKVRGDIDNFVQGLDEKKLVNGSPEAVSALNDARSLAANNFRQNDISQGLMKADGDPKKIQKFFKDYIAKGNLDNLTPEAADTVRQAANGSLTQRTLGAIGKLGVDFDHVVTPTIIAKLGAAPITVPASAARYANKLAVRGNANDVLKQLEAEFQALRNRK